MIKLKCIFALISVLVLVFLFVACNDGGNGQNGGAQGGTPSGAVDSTLKITTSVQDGFTATTVGGETVYTFTKGGEYTLSGTLYGRLEFSADLLESATLYLNGCTISSSVGAIYWQSESGKVEIKAVAGTKNSIVSALAGALDTYNAIESNNNVEIGGSGLLDIVAHSKHAVKASNVEIKGSVTLSIKAVKDGLHAKQVTVVGGNTTITGCIDAIQADLNAKGLKGTFLMTGGVLQIIGCGTAIQAEASATVTAGTLKVTGCDKFLKATTFDIAANTTTVNGVAFS